MECKGFSLSIPDNLHLQPLSYFYFKMAFQLHSAAVGESFLTKAWHKPFLLQLNHSSHS